MKEKSDFKKKILVADDDLKISELLRDVLEEENYVVYCAATTEEAFVLLKRHKPDLIVLDVEIPLKGGLEFCRQVKLDEEFKSTPIVFLTVRDEEIAKISALSLGGDDFVTKPFHTRELLARITVALRRSTWSNPEGKSVLYGNLMIEFDKRMVRINNKIIHLTPKEFDILELLHSNQNRMFSDRDIYAQVWGERHQDLLSTVYTHVNRLRKKLGVYAGHIQTVPGSGFQFVSDLKRK